jgi:hypothetical protein
LYFKKLTFSPNRGLSVFEAFMFAFGHSSLTIRIAKENQASGEEPRPKAGASSASSVSSEEETEETEKSQVELGAHGPITASVKIGTG